jgi:hypothetical protein
MPDGALMGKEAGMHASLDRVDGSGQEPDGRMKYIQTDHRTPDEIARDRHVSVIFAIVRLRNARIYSWKETFNPLVIYSFPKGPAPPDFLREAIAAADAELQLDTEPVPFTGTRREITELLDEATAAIAAEAAKARGAALDMALLTQFEDELGAATPDKDTDEDAYWRAVVTLAAIAAEIIRGMLGGGWASAQAGSVPFVLVSGGLQINCFNKAVQFLEDPVGGGDSLRAFIYAAEDAAARSRR